MDRPRRALRSNPSRVAKLKRPVRETRSTAAYFTSLSSSPDDEFDDGDDSDTPSPRARNSLPPQKRKARNNCHLSTPKKRATRRTRSAVSKTSPKNVMPSTPNSAEPAPATSRARLVYPPWQTLPYHVLQNIFDSAAAAIRDPSSRREDIAQAVGTLMSASRTCRAFAEPALAGLYKCPPFDRQWCYTKAPQTCLGQFLETLALPSATTAINYHPKVKILRLEVASTLARKYNGSYMNLQPLIRSLPNLCQLELYHELDEPPYRRLDERIRFVPAVNELMETLMLSRTAGDGVGDEMAAMPTNLSTWRWNSRLTPDSLSLDKLHTAHQNPIFAGLRKVAFVNYQLASWGLPQRQQLNEQIQERSQRRISQLSSCISALPNLKHLVLESCTLANGSLLSLLPTTLRHLELINCWEITATDFGVFLATRGHSLEALTLNHCQSLSLGFLPILGSACPNLAHLYMDLSYFRHHEHYADNKPEYDQLLLEHEVPTWPSSMQSIEILHMRKWGRKAAEMFFESLAESAPSLCHLRRLAFRIALDISWRQRRELREFWVDRLVRVFKRRAKPPCDFKTLRLPSAKIAREAQGTGEGKQAQKHGGPRSTILPRRRSTRISELPPTPTSSERETSYLTKSEMVRISAVSRELRGLRGSGMLLKEHHGGDEESEDELTADHSDRSRRDRKIKKISKNQAHDDKFIHGLCDVVDIHVDNHRPTERHYGMEDFLDSPDESDPEWDGGDADIF
ncbi:hypothetical protein GGS23DRAFT_567471 [Durotheca rogersii]|uniref:uncharacterized protein n=1 Tax=Durotheca rogersii TaxID=419775 RepID=UPI00221E87FA|nr:uncharacterized protein GGS23DRAFT_567471 [Durotheca rogersii]KAI5863534.1 hypothetical protein GGS23DRAFT_567471 [Durotheca rogersii]